MKDNPFNYFRGVIGVTNTTIPQDQYNETGIIPTTVIISSEWVDKNDHLGIGVQNNRIGKMLSIAKSN